VGTDHDFDRVYREAGPGLWRALYAFAGGRRDIAEEALAEAFARAVEHQERIHAPVPWIYRTAFRVARRELETERRRQGSVEQEVGEMDATPVDLGELVRALRTLSPNQRAAVVLRFEADLDVSEIADRMGLSSATVRVHIHRGRKKLRKLLGADETSDEVTDA
jgi:RNA polymerase sigma-70 factor (ECF subfamily)